MARGRKVCLDVFHIRMRLKRMSEKSTVQKASMPKGTVTFLFTDIEGSTQLWERHFAVMREDLEQHDRLIRAVVGSNGGYIFKTGGDAFHCAFESAPRALSAALQTQKAVAAHQWRVPGGLRVRMALHTGVSEEREEDYFGPTPNRTARLRETAWGGQTFLSQATAALVQDYLPEGASLILRGEHRLKDLLRPEMIYQLHHPELPSDPRKPKSLTVLPNNLPVIGRHLVGRVRELEQIKEALAKTRILTLHAGGGFGKTRLALQVGADLLDTFEHGVWLANIPSTSPEMLPQMVAQVVNVPFLPREDPLGALLFHLEAKNLLLILDGCEHAVDACGALAHKLLSACAGVRILTASQESLNIRDELVWSVPPLSYPSADEAVTLTRVREFDAVQFFYDQASLSNPSFRPTKDNLSWVARICHRFKGVPLHLELAALWVDTLSVQEILSRSAEPYGLLQRGRSDAPARQQSLLASVEWSFRLLDEHERALFNRMSVFQGSCDSEAVEEVCLEEDVERGQVPHLLSRLVKKSFVQTVENPALVMRYRLADTLRMFGEKQLEAAHGLEVLRERHARYFLEFAQKAREGLSSKESRAWLMRLDQDHLNLLSALDWFLDRSNAESALRMVRGLSRFWEIRSYWAQGVQAIENALRLPGALEHPSPRAYALNAAGSLLRLQGAFDKSHAYHSESLALYQELGDQRQKAGVVNNLANLEHDQDHYAEAHRLYSESLAVWRELGDELGIAEVLHNLGSVTRDQGNYAEARERWEEILDIWQRTESKERLAQTLNDLGDLDQQQGKYDSARMRLHSSRRIFRELGNALGVAFATMNLGNLALDQGEFREARRLYRQAARRLD